MTFYIDGPKAEIANVQWNPDTRTVTADVNYANFSDDNSAWIGVVPSDTPHNEQDADRVDVNYISLRDFESGAFPELQFPMTSLEVMICVFTAVIIMAQNLPV